MKSSILLLLLLIPLTNCSDTGRGHSTESVVQEQWYEGGTLHQSKIREWKEATEANKLATCADFLAKIDNSVTMETLKQRATEVKACINEATKDLDSSDNETVSEIAAVCTITLGYH